MEGKLEAHEGEACGNVKYGPSRQQSVVPESSDSVHRAGLLRDSRMVPGFQRGEVVMPPAIGFPIGTSVMQ